MVWLDLRNPDHNDLAVLQDEFGLHPVAIEDALVDRERPKIDHYRTHLFMTAYSSRLDASTGALATSEVSAFILPRALITIRKDDGLDIGKVVDRWDANPPLSAHGVGYLLYGLLDHIVDGHFEAVQALDDEIEALEDDLFAPTTSNSLHVQRRSFELRKSLRAAAPGRAAQRMREVLNTVMRRDVRHVGEELMPYYQDVYDHMLRASEWTELPLRGPGHHDPRDPSDDPGQPDEHHHQARHQLGGDHRRPDRRHRLLRAERSLPRFQRSRRLDRGPGGHGGLVRDAVLGVPPQRLDLTLGHFITIALYGCFWRAEIGADSHPPERTKVQFSRATDLHLSGSPQRYSDSAF